jgi:hypothetical protein
MTGGSKGEDVTRDSAYKINALRRKMLIFDCKQCEEIKEGRKKSRKKE